MNRYSRQQQVPSIGVLGQEKLLKSHVLVVGAGGLGSPVCTLLCGAGIGELTLIDGDLVSLSNLHRQTLYSENDVGRAKVTAAKARLSSMNSEVKINILDTHLTIDNAAQLLDDKTIVIDAADSFLVSYLLSDLCLTRQIPLVTASVASTQGYLGVFCGTPTQAAPSYRAVFPKPSSSNNTCDTIGVTGPSAAIIGSLQAQEAIKVILEDKSQLLGKLLYMDLWDYRQHTVDFSNANEPQHSHGWRSINQLEPTDTLLDVRTPTEVNEAPLVLPSTALPSTALPSTALPSTVLPATNIPLNELEANLSELEPNNSIVCVCRSGQRAMQAANILLANQFTRVLVTHQ